jgi:hypothetical protein
LGQKISRTSDRAFAAANACSHRQLVAFESNTHHRSAHDESFDGSSVAAARLDQRGDRSSKACAQISRLANAASRYRDDAVNERFACAHKVRHRGCRADVLTQHADIRRDSTAWNFFLGQRFDQLPLAAGRVVRRNRAHLNAWVAQRFARCSHGRQGCGLIGFDSDDRSRRCNCMHQYLHAEQNSVRVFAH